MATMPSVHFTKKQEQANVLWCMKQYIQENPFEVKYEWGKVHQDDVKTWDNLTLKGKLNCQVDELSKK